MFIKDSIVIIITQYYKGYYIYGQEKIIYQYLPQEVGELLVYFKQLVQLFIKLIKAKVQD